MSYLFLYIQEVSAKNFSVSWWGFANNIVNQIQAYSEIECKKKTDDLILNSIIGSKVTLM